MVPYTYILSMAPYIFYYFDKYNSPNALNFRQGVILNLCQCDTHQKYMGINMFVLDLPIEWGYLKFHRALNKINIILFEIYMWVS